jgi:putative glutamine amidotransferase
VIAAILVSYFSTNMRALARSQQPAEKASGITIKPHPKGVQWVLPRLSTDEGSISIQKYINSISQVNQIKEFGPHQNELHDISVGNLEYKDIEINLSKRILIVANRRNDHLFNENRINSVSRQLRSRGLHPYLLPVGASLSLNKKEREDFHEDLSSKFAGVILLGGADVDPKIYGREVNGAVDFSNLRDQLELDFIKDFLKYGTGPILGICRGSQLLAVAHGCYLLQDIPSQHPTHLFHGKGDDGNPSFHNLIFQKTKNNHIAKSLGISQEQFGKRSSFITNSTHHQFSVIHPGSGLEVVATTEDGVTEIFEDASSRVLGVQSHPENPDPSGFGEAIFDLFQSKVHSNSCSIALSLEAA